MYENAGILTTENGGINVLAGSTLVRLHADVVKMSARIVCLTACSFFRAAGPASIGALTCRPGRDVVANGKRLSDGMLQIFLPGVRPGGRRTTCAVSGHTSWVWRILTATNMTERWMQWAPGWASRQVSNMENQSCRLTWIDEPRLRIYRPTKNPS